MVDLAAIWDLHALPWIVSAVVGTAAAIGLAHFYRHQRFNANPRPLLTAGSGD
jgi:hypothetical protein